MSRESRRNKGSWGRDVHISDAQVRRRQAKSLGRAWVHLLSYAIRESGTISQWRWEAEKQKAKEYLSDKEWQPGIQGEIANSRPFLCSAHERSFVLETPVTEPC